MNDHGHGSIWATKAHRSRRRLVWALVLGLSLAALIGCQPTRLRAPVYGSDINVVGIRNFPDPAVLVDGGQFYAFSTNSVGSNSVHIGTVTSADSINWTNPYNGSQSTGDALPNPPQWARPLSQGGGFWGPSITKLAGRYVLHFSARHKSVSNSRPGWCVGHAISNTPEGPYTASSRPLFCRVTSPNAARSSVTTNPATNQGSYDPQVFVVAGRVYLHFKALDSPNHLWGIRLRSDGRAVSGSAVGMVSLASNARTWEYSPRQRFTVLENPAMDYNPNARSSGYPYYLYYSGGDWQTSSYATGIAACRGPLGPCFRATGNAPWLKSRGSASGPGGLSHFRIGNSRWVAYHSYERGAPSGNGRRLHIEPLGYDGLTSTLLSRQPTGSFTTSVEANGDVEVSGFADDPDTGSPVLVVVREGTRPLTRLDTEGDGTWSTTFRNLAPGSHNLCVLLGDDNGLAARSLGCQVVSVPAAASTTEAETTPTTAPMSTTQPGENPTPLPPLQTTTTAATELNNP